MIRWVLLGVVLLGFSYGLVGAGLIESYREFTLARQSQINKQMEGEDVARPKTEEDEDDDETVGARWVRAICNTPLHTVLEYVHLACTEE